MIPLWLTPKVIKGSIIGAVCLALFVSGCLVTRSIMKGNLDKVKYEYSVLLENNKQCLTQNGIAAISIGELEAAIKKQNEAYAKLASDSAIALASQREKHRLALDRYRRSTQASIEELEAQKALLLKRMETMTAAEACHEAWSEVVK